ncbi:MAG: hypothetical protein AB1806_17465 [Acidobacteriota bacterium]
MPDAFAMTYNFDPDRWFENQRRLLDGRLARGELDEAAHQAEMDALEERYERLLARLDRDFELEDREKT